MVVAVPVPVRGPVEDDAFERIDKHRKAGGGGRKSDLVRIAKQGQIREQIVGPPWFDPALHEESLVEQVRRPNVLAGLVSRLKVTRKRPVELRAW